MATKPIKGTEIIESGALSKTIEDAKALLTILDQMDGEFVKIAKSSKKAAQGLNANVNNDLKRAVAEEKALTAALVEQEKVKRAKIQTTKQIKSLEATGKRNKATEEKALTTALVDQEKIKRSKIATEKTLISLNKQKTAAAAKNIRQLESERNAYKRLSAETNAAQAELKRLATVFGVNSKEAKKALLAFDKLDNKLRAVNNVARDGRRDVGRYGLALKGLKGTATSLVSTFQRLGVTIGAAFIARNIGGIIADFSQAQGDLLAISGKTEAQLTTLTAQAKRLGETSQFSATQITLMQVELAKLGFSVKQIEQSTEPVANFAAATGVELPRAAKLAGSALRAFNLDASEMERVVSTLGVATTKSALDFSQLETGLSTVAPVANAFGFSIEETTALLGGLSNAGFDASSAATATRNILLNLADANGDLAKSLGRPVEGLDDLLAGLKQLDSDGIDLAETLNLTDKRSVAAFNTFLKGTDDIDALKLSITGANEELKQMAEKRLDTVGGQLTLLKSAWEGFILGADGASGASSKFKSIIGFLARNLSTILGLVVSAGKAWLIYKTTVIAVNTINKASNLLLSIQTKGLKSLFISQKAVTKGAKGAAVAQKGLNSAMKANPIGLVISGLFLLADTLGIFSGGLEDNTELLDINTDALEDNNEQIAESIRLKEELAGIEKTIQGQLSNVTKISDSQLKNLKTTIEDTAGLIENLSIEELKEQDLLTEEQLESLSKLESERLEILNSEIEVLQVKNQVLSETTESAQNISQQYISAETSKTNELDAVNKINDGLSETLKSKEFQDDIQTRLTENTNKQNAILDSIKNNEIELTEEQKRQLALVNAEIERRKIGSKERTGSREREQKELTGIELLQKNQSIAQKLLNDELVDNLGAENKRTELLREQLDILDFQIEKYKFLSEEGGGDIEAFGRVQGKGAGRIEPDGRQTELATDDSLPATPEELEELSNQLKSIAQNFTDVTLQLSNQRIAALDREAEAQRRLYDESKAREQDVIAQRSASDSSKATSLAFEKEAQAKALKEQEKIAKKRARIELFNSGLNLLNNYVQEGKGVSDVVGDMGTLVSALDTLTPAFWEGTDTTVGDSLGMKYSSGRDGILARVDASEMILNKKKVDTLSGYGVKTTDDIVNRVKMGSMFKAPNATIADKIINVNNQELIGKLDSTNSLLQQIASRPNTELGIEELGTVIKLTEKITRGNKVTTTTTHKRAGR